MCRAALGGESNSAQAQAVNDGIVYLMAVPYVLVAGIGYAVYRMRKNKDGLSNCFYFSPLMETLISPFTLRKAMIALFVN
jgi:hypothetical protein